MKLTFCEADILRVNIEFVHLVVKILGVDIL